MADGKLAILLPNLLGGGSQRAMLNLAGEFARKGLEVDVLLARSTRYEYTVPDRVRLIDLGAPRIYASLPTLIKYLKREQPSTILSAETPVNVIALCARRFARLPVRVVISEHTIVSEATKESRDLRVRLLPQLMRWSYPSAEAVVAVSKGVRDDLLQIVSLPGDKVHVIYNPININEIFIKAKEPLHHPWFSNGEPPVVLGVGRLTAAKDFSTLIHAFSLVRKERPAHLMILGEGEERPTLEQLVRKLKLEEDVALPGFVGNVYKYMKRAAVFVLSSRWEGFGNVLVEAMACGTRLVSTDCPAGPAEILEGGKWGKLVPVGDWQALAQAINEALDSPKQHMAERVKQFSCEVIAEKYKAVLWANNDAQ